MRIANAAEQMAGIVLDPALYVLIPADPEPQAIKEARRWVSEAIKPTAGIWTVEEGLQGTGLHLNVLARYQDPLPPFKGRLYRERIKKPIRAVAAYIAKPQGAPNERHHIAKTSGRFGDFRTWAYLLSKEAPVIAGIALQHDLAPDFVPAPAPLLETDKERARRWLSVLYSRCPNLAPKS